MVMLWIHAAICIAEGTAIGIAGCRKKKDLSQAAIEIAECTAMGIAGCMQSVAAIDIAEEHRCDTLA